MQNIIDCLSRAVDDLGAWLTDNTDGVFEEQPEIDNIRTLLMDALERAIELEAKTKPVQS